MTEIKKPLKTKLPAEVYYQEVNIRNFKQVYNAKAKMEAADYNMYFNPSYDFVYLVYFIFNLNTFYYIILRILTLLYGAVSSAARRSTCFFSLFSRLCFFRSYSPFSFFFIYSLLFKQIHCEYTKKDRIMKSCIRPCLVNI